MPSRQIDSRPYFLSLARLLALACFLLLGLAGQARAELSFAAAVNYGAGSFPFSVVVADFNGDGKTDLAVANAASDNVSILLGNGNGTFAAAANYSLILSSAFVAVGDFNDDGKADLTVSSINVSILLGNGNGAFAEALNYYVVGESVSITAGDFNGDGKADLAVANVNRGNVSILLGNGNGTFTFTETVRYGMEGGSVSIAVGDFNGDGKADLAIPGSNNISILLGNGNGTFATAVNYGAGSFPYSVAVGDFNGDGKADLAVANAGSNNISILLGNGDGTFAAALSYGAGNGFDNGGTSIAVGDFNLDGKTDVAVVKYNRDISLITSYGNLYILGGNGDGTFTAAVNYCAGIAPHFVAVGDFNGDGKADLAVANAGGNNVSILLNTSNLSNATPTGMVVEFYNTNLDHYFITADTNEASAIDSGSAGPGWMRTGNSFKSGGSTSVCRFYGSMWPGPNSHFYTVDPGECAFLKQLQAGTPATQKRWNFESLDFASTPPANGACPCGSVPVYRAYNNGFPRGVDSNHRITSSPTAIWEVMTRGWINEGVAMCAPN